MKVFVLIFLFFAYLNAMEKITISSKHYITIPKMSSKVVDGYTFNVKNKKIKPFKIAKYELSIKEYLKYLKDTNQINKVKNIINSDVELNEPMTNIDFKEAYATCRHYGARLPTEFEWVVASSIKLSKSICYEQLKPYSFHATSIDKLSSKCMKTIDEEFEADVVGSELNDVEFSVENINGTFGMYGNVWEWTSSSKKVFNTKYKIIKGGSFTNFTNKELFDVRVSNFVKEDTTMQNIGVRCVWDILDDNIEKNNI